MSLDWTRVTEIVSDAIGLEPDQRVVYLGEVCGDSDELGAEVLALVSAHELAGNFLEQPAALIPDVEKPPANENIGRKLGPYQVDDALGTGSMGVVLLATDTRTNRQVTLKTLPPLVTRDQELREYVLRETQAVAAMAHRNINRIIGIEEVYGQFYLVSEYVPGSSLRSLIESGPVPPETAAAIGLQVAQALAAAHSMATSHRDLRPENIVCGENGIVKVLDFGLMPLIEAQTTMRAKTRNAPPSTASASYWSPEQVGGTGVDFRSDQFTFGVILYEMIAGRSPFDAPTPAAIATNITARTPPPLSTVNGQVSPILNRIVSRCLEKDREKRYEKTSELVSELSTCIEGEREAETARDLTLPTANTRGRKKASSRRAAWTTHQLMTMALYAVSAILAWQVGGTAGSSWSLLLLVAVCASLGLGAVSRVQLLASERLGTEAFAATHRRISATISGVDALAGLLMLALAFSEIWSHLAAAGLLGFFGTWLAVSALTVELSKTRSAFPGLRKEPPVAVAPPAEEPPAGAPAAITPSAPPTDPDAP